MKHYARLTIHDFAKMPKGKRSFMVKWLRALALEFKKANPKDYSNPFRATLYK